MGDIIFGALALFEFVQLLSLLPTFIDDTSTETIKELSIYPISYYFLDNVIYI